MWTTKTGIYPVMKNQTLTASLDIEKYNWKTSTGISNSEHRITEEIPEQGKYISLEDRNLGRI